MQVPLQNVRRQYNANNAKNEAKANTKFTVKAEKFQEKETWLVVAAKPTTGSAQLRVLKLNDDRPAAPVTPTVRPPHTKKKYGDREPLPDWKIL